MQLYVLDRAKNTLATTSDYYNDKHTKILEAGSSSYEFTIDKTDKAAQQMVSGNYIITQDDQGRNWAFAILDYDETHLTKTVYCEDVGIELINKAMDIWPNTGTHSFEYYFDLVTKDTPWKLGINQLSGLSRMLTYTGQDTGLGRLLSILTGFDHAECIFNVQFTMNAPVEFTIDVYKQIGTVQSNIQIVYNNELDDIKKTESRAEFVTALKGVGGTIEPEVSDDGTTTTTTTDTQETVDFSDLEYDDGDYYTVKGDPFLRARTANKKFNPGDNGWIENFYSYDTQDPKELLNRTITRLKTYSEPQYTYEAEVKVIDATLDIGDTVTIIDHDYQPALYLSARVATLEKSYTDPTKNMVTFTNYQLLNSSLTGRIKDLQNIINGMPTSSQITAINANLVKLVAANNQLKQQLEVVITSADGTTNNYYGETQPSDAKEGDTWFKKVDGKVVEIDTYVNGEWVPITLTTDQVKNMVGEATADIPELKAQIADSLAKADAANAKFNESISQITDLSATVEGVKTDAATASTNALTAINNAKTATVNAQSALDTATSTHDEIVNLTTVTDDLAGTMETLATKESLDKVSGTVSILSTDVKLATDQISLKADRTTVDTLTKQVTSNTSSITANANAIKLKADQSTVDSLNGNVTSLSSEITTQANQIKLMVSKTDLATAVNGMATQTYVADQLQISSDKFSNTISQVQNQLDSQTLGFRNLIPNSTFKLGQQGWTGWDTTSVYTQTETYHSKTYTAVFMGYLADGVVYKDLISTAKIPLKPNTAYTIRVLTRSIISNNNFIFTEEKSADNTVINDHAWQLNLRTADYQASVQHWTTSANADHATFRVRVKPNDEFMISEIMLVEGNTLPTDHIPAPEDSATVEALTSVSQTVDAIKVMATDNQHDLTTLTANVNGWQATVDDQINDVKNTQTSLANQWTQEISATGSPNLIDGALWSDVSTSNDNNAGGVNSAKNLLLATHDYYTGAQPLYRLDNMTSTEDYAYSNRFALKKNTVYVVSFLGFAGSNVSSMDLWVLARTKGSTNAFDDAIEPIMGRKLSPSKAEYVVATFNSGNNVSAYLRFDNNGTTDGKRSSMFFTEVQVEEGSLATAFRPSTTVMSTNITELQNQFNVSVVKKGDVVTQLNLDAGTALIQSNKIYMDASSTIFSGKAFIPSAAITDLTADKITTGTLNASNVKVINIDGANIVANSITANQLSTQAIQVGLSNWGEDLALQPNGLILHDEDNIVFELNRTGMWVSNVVNNAEAGWIHSNQIVGHENLFGLSFDLAHDAHYMSWGYQDTANGDYKNKLSWFDTTSANTLGKKQGFHFSNNVYFDEDNSSPHMNQLYTLSDGVGLWFERGTVGDRPAVFMRNQNKMSGIAWTDDGALYLGRANSWYNLYDILKGAGFSV